VRRSSRTSDLCTRIGPSRFGVTLTETDEIAAINFVERVREAGPRSMPKGADGLQFSFGWASPKQGESADAVVRRAESRLALELAEV
jgi:GGDEF domain-containing protein